LSRVQNRTETKNKIRSVDELWTCSDRPELVDRWTGPFPHQYLNLFHFCAFFFSIGNQLHVSHHSVSSKFDILIE
jgi:hypothetical protein